MYYMTRVYFVSLCLFLLIFSCSKEEVSKKEAGHIQQEQPSILILSRNDGIVIEKPNQDIKKAIETISDVSRIPLGLFDFQLSDKNTVHVKELDISIKLNGTIQPRFEKLFIVPSLPDEYGHFEPCYPCPFLEQEAYLSVQLEWEALFGPFRTEKHEELESLSNAH